jgi:Flp pilus assembly protein TadG
MMKSFYRLLISSRGSTLIETALTLPMLFLMLLGAVELARVASAASEVTGAAKAGAAYGAQNHGTQGDVPGIRRAATREVDSLPGLAFTGTDVQATLSGRCSSNIGNSTCTGPDYGSGPTCTNTDCGVGDHALTIVTVRTTGTIDPLIHIPGLPSLFTVYGQASQTVLQP